MLRNITRALALTLFAIPCHAQPVNGQGTWETTLLARDLDGDPGTIEGYYDTALDITWMASLDNPTPSSIRWMEAVNATASMNIGGITGWRLPSVRPVNGVAFQASDSNTGTKDLGRNISAPGSLYAGSTASEMAHMYYNTLGNLSQCDPVLSSDSTCSPQSPGAFNTGPFIGLSRTERWSGTDYIDTPVPAAWTFDFVFWGVQQARNKQETHALWAVHSGDVGASVPDADGDFIPDARDNCTLVPNWDQLDTDGDTLGNACDTDDDGDTVIDTSDNCPLDANGDQLNTDGDGFGDVCDDDDDNDAVMDSADNCRLVINSNQRDADFDGYGNICDADLNNSGLTTSTDFNLLRSVLNQSANSSPLAAAADINGSGLVTSTDFGLLRARLNTAPGPSGLFH